MSQNTPIPCAHCGGKAELGGYTRRQFGGFYVGCTLCDASIGKNNIGDGEAGGTVEDHVFESEQEAIAAWNRRVVPTATGLNAFIDQIQRLLERSKACANNPANAQKEDYYNGQSHGIEVVLDALKDVMADAFKLSPNELKEARSAFELMIYKTTGWTIESCYRTETNDYHQETILNPAWQKFQKDWVKYKAQVEK